MSESISKKNRYKNILANQPICILCGTKPSSSIDHIPPKVVFSGRHAPEGFEFGTCSDCNNGSTEYDYLIGFFARLINSETYTTIEHEELAKFFEIMQKHYSHILKEMGELTTRDKRIVARETGLKPQPGELYSDMPFLRVPKALHNAMIVQVAKISKALHFKHSDVIVPINASIRFRWFTNINQMRGDSPLIKEVFRIVQPSGAIKRSKSDLKGQFDYQYAIAPSKDIAVYVCVFGKAFGFLSFLTFDPSIIDGIINDVRNKNGYTNEGFLRAQWPPDNSI